MATAEDKHRNKIERPETEFGKPSDVIKDKELSSLEKRTALENWKQDALEALVAADEGMPATDEDLETADEEMHDVALAETQLGQRKQDTPGQ